MKQTQDYSWADQGLSSSNFKIYQGLRYIDSHRIINDKHKYLDAFDFLLGDLIYEGDYYTNLQLKFDLYQQQLIVLHPESDGITAVALDMNLVDAFRIGTHTFEKKQLQEQTLFLEYHQTIDGIQVWQHHYKKLNYKQNNALVYYEFTPKNTLYLFKDQNWIQVKKNHDLKPYFPAKSNALKNAELAYHNLIKLDNNTYIRQLIKSLSN